MSDANDNPHPPEALNYVFFDPLAMPPVWVTCEVCKVTLPNGVGLTATVYGPNSSSQGAPAYWVVFRQAECQNVQIGGREELSIEAAKTAAWNGMRVWRDTMNDGVAAVSANTLPTANRQGLDCRKDE